MTQRQVRKNTTFGQIYSTAEEKLKKLFGRPEIVLPLAGDYVRITNMHDLDYGHIAEVLWVDDAGAMDLTDVSVQIKLNPFGGGVKIQRPISYLCFKILNEMEVLAEASK